MAQDHFSHFVEGRVHALRCPIPSHPGDRSGRSLKVRKTGDTWMLKCWSGGCSYAKIAAALGITIRPVDARSNSLAPFLVASYDHPDGEPRKVYRKDWPRDFPNAPSCPWRACSTPTLNPHKHVWGKGSPTGTELELWGEDHELNVLVLVEGEKAAAALAAAGVNDHGFTPASWRGGTGSVGKVSFARVKGRRVVLWPDNDKVGRSSMDTAADRCAQADAEVLQLVEVDALGLDEGGDAADIEASERLSVLTDHVVVFVPSAPAPSTPPAAGPAKVPDWLAPHYSRLLEDSYDVQNPAADAERYLRQHGPHTLIVRDVGGQRDGESYVLGLDKLTGLWGGTAAIERAILEQAELAFETVKAGIGPGGQFPRRTLSYLGKVSRSREAWRSAMDTIPAVDGVRGPFEVVSLPESEIDKPGRYLGCANGVVDLTTRKLLPPDQGKLKGVTRSTPVVYREGARHEYVDKLFSHLDGETTEYLKSILGQGLFGQPDGLTLVLTGPTRAGKTTLMEAMRAAAGPSYYGTASVDVTGRGGRYSGGSHTEDRRAIYTMRYCGIVEAEGARVDPGRFKSMTGGDTAPFRGIGQSQTSLRPTALIIWAANSMPKLGMDDPAVQERVRIVDYPQLPPGQRDPAVKQAFSAGESGPAEAMLAMLVDYASRNPPGSAHKLPASMRDALEREVREAQNQLAVWINTVMVEGYAHDAVTVNELWELWCQRCGGASTSGQGQEIGGVKRRSFPGEVRQWFRAVGLPPVKPVRVATGVTRGWRRVRLAGDQAARLGKLEAPPTRYCDAELHDGAPCGQELSGGEACPVADTHAAKPTDPPADGGS